MCVRGYCRSELLPEPFFGTKSSEAPSSPVRGSASAHLLVHAHAVSAGVYADVYALHGCGVVMPPLDTKADWWVNDYVLQSLNHSLLDGVHWDCSCEAPPKGSVSPPGFSLGYVIVMSHSVVC